MTPPATRRWDRETALLAEVAVVVSVISFLFYFHNDCLLLYGDAVAHINIARRVFDSRTPGLLQLGTVWLPLPHLLMIPFLVSNWAWQTGFGGSVPSLVAYVVAVDWHLPHDSRRSPRCRDNSEGQWRCLGRSADIHRESEPDLSANHCDD